MLKVRISLWGGFLLALIAMYFKKGYYQPMDQDLIATLSALALWIVYGIALWFMVDLNFFKKENLKTLLFSTAASISFFGPALYFNVVYFGGEIAILLFWWIVVWGIINSKFIKKAEISKTA